MMEFRIKNLAKTKAYREAVSGLRERDIGPRKRVIIAPRMTSVDGRLGGNISCLQNVRSVPNGTVLGKEKQTAVTTESSSMIGNVDLNSYKSWVEERKKLRKDLNQCGMVSEWLQSKPSLTEIEQRVRGTQLIAADDDLLTSRIKNRKMSKDGHIIYGHCDSKFPPAINQPMPIALATINEYLAKKKLRFYDLFVQADRDKDWKISREEFKDIMIRTGIPLKYAEIDQLVQALDENGDDVLEYKELAHGRDLFIRNERTRKQSEDETIVQPLDTSMRLQEGDALYVGQIGKRISSQSLLNLPEVLSSDHIFNSKDQDDDKRSKRQRKKEKHRQKARGSEAAERKLCSMRGTTGLLVDTFQKQKESEYERVLELCHLHGVPLSKNLLARVLLHPEDRDVVTCISSLKPPSTYLTSEKELYRRLAPNDTDSGGKRFSKSKRKITFYSYHVYPLAASVSPKFERMNLSSGPANISRKADCWMTYEEYCNLTRHLDSRFEKSWKPSDEDSYWPSYVHDKVRLYLERPRTQVRSENSIFEIVHNRTIH